MATFVVSLLVPACGNAHRTLGVRPRRTKMANFPKVAKRRWPSEFGHLRALTALLCSSLLAPLSAQNVGERIAEIRKLKREPLLLQPFRNDIPSVKCEFRVRSHHQRGADANHP